MSLAGKPGQLARVRHLQRRGLRAAHPVARGAARWPPSAPRPRWPSASAAPTPPPGASPGACTTSPIQGAADKPRAAVLRPRHLAAVGRPRSLTPSAALMPWVETETLSFAARHESGQTDSVERLLDDLERFRDRARAALRARCRARSRWSSTRASLMLVAGRTRGCRPARMVSAPAGPPLLRRLVQPARDPRAGARRRWRRARRGWPARARRMLLSPAARVRAPGGGRQQRRAAAAVHARTFRRYLRMAWVSEGSATYLAGQVPHMRAAVARRMREGGRPAFPPAAPRRAGAGRHGVRASWRARRAPAARRRAGAEPDPRRRRWRRSAGAGPAARSWEDYLAGFAAG